MKRIFAFLLLALLLCGCGRIQVYGNTGLFDNQYLYVLDSSEATKAESTIPTETAPLHSEFYIEGLSLEQLLVYFKEVVLDAESYSSGNPDLIQKWVDPITYRIYGEYTQEDSTCLDYMLDILSSIDGFPGMVEAEAGQTERLSIYFYSYPEIQQEFPEMGYNTEGRVSFNYNDDNEITRETIIYRNDIDQSIRNSVILEEIYNGLGPIQDTDLRADSVIYQYSSTAQVLSDVDMLILQLLYHPQIRCGMDYAQCEEVIRQLYY